MLGQENFREEITNPGWKGSSMNRMQLDLKVKKKNIPEKVWPRESDRTEYRKEREEGERERDVKGTRWVRAP